LGADHVLRIGIENDDVRVGSDGNGALSRKEAEQFCRSGGDNFDETVCGEALAVNAARVDEAEAMFDARAAVGDFSEVVSAQFFLFPETEGTVIGGDNLQCVMSKSMPELFLVPFFAEGRSEDVFGTFETRSVHIF